jgi:hypothetical protein
MWFIVLKRCVFFYGPLPADLRGNYSNGTNAEINYKKFNGTNPTPLSTLAWYWYYFCNLFANWGSFGNCQRTGSNALSIFKKNRNQVYARAPAEHYFLPHLADGIIAQTETWRLDGTTNARAPDLSVFCVPLKVVLFFYRSLSLSVTVK